MFPLFFNVHHSRTNMHALRPCLVLPSVLCTLLADGSGCDLQCRYQTWYSNQWNRTGFQLEMQTRLYALECFTNILRAELLTGGGCVDLQSFNVRKNIIEHLTLLLCHLHFVDVKGLILAWGFWDLQRRVRLGQHTLRGFPSTKFICCHVLTLPRVLKALILKLGWGVRGTITTWICPLLLLSPQVPDLLDGGKQRPNARVLAMKNHGICAMWAFLVISISVFHPLCLDWRFHYSCSKWTRVKSIICIFVWTLSRGCCWRCSQSLWRRNANV